MRFVGLMTMFLAWNLLEVTGQPTVALRCRLFASSRREPIQLDLVTAARRKELLHKFLTCAEADSQIDLDGFHFSYKDNWSGSNAELTGLMAATIYHVNDVARTLLHYTKDFNAQNKHGWSALHYAARVGNTDILNILLDIGGDVNTKNKGLPASFRSVGFTPLMTAAYAAKNTTASILIARGAHLDTAATAAYFYRYTALMLAAIRGSMSIVAELLDHGADKHLTGNGWTAEMFASNNGHPDIANFIRNYRGY